ncbi:MAG: AI-2E family transporter [Pseudomonadota bacterium]
MTDEAKSDGQVSDGLTADRQTLQRGFIVVLALAVSAVFLWMIRDFLSALFIAAVLAIFLGPLQRWLSRVLGNRPRLAASVVLVLAVFVIVIPILAALALAARQAAEVGTSVLPWIQTQIAAVRAEGLTGLPDWVPFRDMLAPYQDELLRRASQLASSVGGAVFNGLTRATGGALGFSLGVVVFLFALFYLLTAGETLKRGALELLPMRPVDRHHLAERTLSTIRATVKGTFVIALIQGSLTGGALAVAGVPGAALWGALAALLSIIPGVGPPLVWLPAAIWLYVTGQPLAALGVAAWGALVVGVIDNILRPTLVGKDAKMSDLMVLLSTLGGLTMFGATGIIVGPVIAALFTSAWYIYAESYGPLLKAAQPKPDNDQTDSIPPA